MEKLDKELEQVKAILKRRSDTFRAASEELCRASREATEQDRAALRAASMLRYRAKELDKLAGLLALFFVEVSEEPGGKQRL